MTSYPKSVTSLSFFLIYGQFRAIRKPDSERMVSKTFIFIRSNFLQKLKTEVKTSNTALILLF